MWDADVARGAIDEQFYVDTVPMHRLGLPSEVGKLVVFLCSDDASYITGSVHTIDGALTVHPCRLTAAGAHGVFLPLVDVFGDDEVTQLFSEESIVGAWLEVERALAHVQAELGIIPAEAAAAIDAAATSGPHRPREPPRAHARRRLSDPAAARADRRTPHPRRPATSTGARRPRTSWTPGWRSSSAVRSTGSTRSIGELGDEMAAKADAHRATVMPGRTHAQPAVPITFGGKLAVWLAELTRHRQRLRAARERAVVVQLFGAAGTAAALGPQSRAVRHGLAERLGLGSRRRSLAHGP